MEYNYLHTFRLAVHGLSQPVEFRMAHDLDNAAQVTDAFAKYVARQEDDFLPLGATGAVRASRVVHISHVRVQKVPAKKEDAAQ
jgi:hypothetical protein